MTTTLMQADSPSLPMSKWANGRFAKYLYWFGRLISIATFGHGKLQIYLFCAQPIGQGAYAAVRDDPNTVIKPTLPDDALVAQFPRPPQVITQRYARGAQCYSVTVKGEFAGYIWLAKDFYDEDEVRCRYELPVGGHSVWDFDVYVAPRYRLGRTLARLWKAVDAAISAQGVQWSVSRISLFNAASIQTHERLGADHLATGVFVVLGSVQLSLFSRHPYIHFGFLDKQQPVIHLEPATAIQFLSK